MSAIVVRPLTEDDFLRWHGISPPCRVWGKVAERDGELLGIAVVAMQAGVHVGYLNMKDELRKHPHTLHRQMVRGLREWAKRGGTVIRIMCDEEMPRSREWAARLGFTPTNGDENGVWSVRVKA